MIPVTKTFLPPQEEYQAILSRAWNAGWITNRGILVEELEEKLIEYLGVPNIIATTNGTLPIQIAIKALGLTGEIITTPFSYVATTSSIVWENCKPVFVDIDPEYWTIDENKIEVSITSRTSAILATHVFGNPCNIEAIEKIAKKHGIKVIYDAAHCFGVKYMGESIFNYGDISTCSFHATKLFHTGEGGALFTRDHDLHHKLFYHHNFGHKGQEGFQGLGINAKMSEMQAAMGLAVFPHLKIIIESRKKVFEEYMKFLPNINTIKIREGTVWNYSYFPVIFKSEKELQKIKRTLNIEGIFPRRYFHPSLNRLPYVNSQKCIESEFVSQRVLCLPVYKGIYKADIKNISEIILRNLD